MNYFYNSSTGRGPVLCFYTLASLSLMISGYLFYSQFEYELWSLTNCHYVAIALVTRSQSPTADTSCTQLAPCGG